MISGMFKLNKKLKKTGVIILCAAALFGIAPLNGCGREWQEPTLDAAGVIDAADA